MAAEAERRSQERRTRIGGDLKAMRIRRAWTQEQLGERTGIGRMSVATWSGSASC